MSDFLQQWSEATSTTLAYFWKALWAFCLGYVISSAIQIFVTRERMRKSMGDARVKSIGLGTFFGFISSSCSFAALAATRSLFKKGAGLIPSLAFLLSSTNLVIELGVVISIFLGWQFIVGEYAGGVLMILMMAGLVVLTRPKELVRNVRERLHDEEGAETGEEASWKQKICSRDAWGEVASKYYMEWMMVWKDVTVGFTVAGIISAFVPKSFFQWLFIGTGGPDAASFGATLEHALVGPIAAFFTFIGSMGNIPLAAVLFANGVSFAGIMAFIFSDLIVFPVLRMNAKFYGWKMALYIAAIFFLCIVGTALLMHWGFFALGSLPEPMQDASNGGNRLSIDQTFWMNAGALLLTLFFAWLAKSNGKSLGTSMAVGSGWIEKLLLILTVCALLWLGGGLLVAFSAQ